MLFHQLTDTTLKHPAERDASLPKRSGMASIGSCEAYLLQDVTLHGSFELHPGWPVEVRQGSVQRIQLKEIAPALDGRTGSIIPEVLPIVQTFARSRRQILRLCCFGKASGVGR